ncbi:MAG: hypothetical protein BVN31_13365 [Proteobacteria bacterium ST_bin15]|nr:MAG: hypothetical protein BVN31_13365 [Proteobacteria bacterium ST_bin15]
MLPAVKLPIIVLVLACAVQPLLAQPAPHAGTTRCLSIREARAEVQKGHALTLARIKHVLEENLEGDMLRAHLCEKGERLVYNLTILHKAGKVRLLVVDAATGQIVAEDD